MAIKHIIVLFEETANRNNPKELDEPDQYSSGQH